MIVAVGEGYRPSIPVSTETALAIVVSLFVLQVVAVVVYFSQSSTRLLAIRYTVYPIVWITIGAWVFVRRPRVPTSTSRRFGAAIVAVGYFLLLSNLGGLLQLSSTPASIRLAMLSPGWGPALFYSNEWIQLSVIPFEVVGYAALAALVYTVVLLGTKSAFAGVFGLATCVGCIWPLGAATVAALGGTLSPLGATAPGYAYDLSTVLFVGTTGVLYWAAWRTVGGKYGE